MKKILPIASVFIALNSFGQGFGTTPTNWPVPVGGIINGGNSVGFFLTGGAVASSYDIGSKNWQVFDINGDAKSDLVVTSEKMSNGSTTVYSPTSAPYWKVYLGTGSAFSSSVTNWPVPVGGLVNGGTNLGFWLTAAVTASSYDIGSTNWVLMDMNGDARPDLVITSEKMSNGNTTVYSPTSNPYWKVYTNTGTAFSSIPTNWPVPVGGQINGGTNLGFRFSASVTASSYDIGTSNWELIDMNADSRPDLVLCSEKMSNGSTTIYSPTSNPYWKVHLNTGSAFSSTVTNWPVPVGGHISGGTNLGFRFSASSAAPSYDIGTTNWQLVDMNGDKRLDLLIYSEKMSNGNTTIYSPASSPYWKIYQNTGTGFQTSASNWSVPVGGHIFGGVSQGYRYISSTIAASYDIGSTNWELTDMNGDARPDLVITSERMSNGNTTIYSPSSNPYWKIYFNTGSNFAGASSNWPVPVGGVLNGGIVHGFFLSNYTTAASYDLGSHNWQVFDINGDTKPDLVITSEKMSGGTTVYSPTSNPYWKVYINSGLSSITENSAEVLDVYPNPFSDRITVNCEKGTAVLYNVLGETAGFWLLVTGKNELNLPNLSPGIYFLQVSSENGTVTTKKLLKDLR